ncbi:DUF1565 domain-containing protein [Candidatus Poribacteria bacterium]|nr:DUF1565 domain-containing protein [Candidatus Poribacteria bacterium]
MSERGADENDGRSEATAIRTIGAALERAAAGDVILVHAGAYAEALTLGKPVALIGEDARTTSVVGTGDGDVIRIASEGVSLRGFTVTNSGASYAGPFDGGDAGIRLEQVTGCTITDCVVTGNAIGIFLNVAHGNVVEGNICHGNAVDGIYVRRSDDNTIERNECHSNDGHGGIYLNPASSRNLLRGNICHSNADHGIKLQEASDDNVIEDNACDGNRHTGIFLRTSTGNVLARNSCVANGQPGIYMQSSTRNTLDGNVVSGSSADWGIVLRDGSHGNTLTSNVVSENGNGIDLLSSDDNLLLDNTIRSNEHAGLTFENSKNNRALYNSVTMNRVGFSIGTHETGGVRVGDLSGNRLYGNAIARNETAGIDSEAAIEIDATLNWWGDRSGPQHASLNVGGRGDGLRDGVRFDPWMAARPALKWTESVDAGTTTRIDARCEANAEVTIATNSDGSGRVYLAEFPQNPGADLATDATIVGRWIDFATDIAEDGIEWPVTIRLYYSDAELRAAGVADELLLRMHRWDWGDGAWLPCSESGVDPRGDFAWASVREAGTVALVAPVARR